MAVPFLCYLCCMKNSHLMHKAIIPFLLSFMLLVSCDNRSYRIEGSVAHGYFNGDSVYVKTLSGDSLRVVAQGVVGRGKFELSGTADSALVVSLYISHTPVAPFVMEPGTITVSLGNDNAVVGGTALNDELARFVAMKDSFDTMLSEILRKEARLLMNGVPADEARRVIEREFSEAVENAEVCTDSFVRMHYDDVLGPFLFGLYSSGMSYGMLPARMKRLYDESPAKFRASRFLELLKYK